MLTDTQTEEHSNPNVRLLEVVRTQQSGSCGFHLTRSKWDPYPWVSAVDPGSAAESAGMIPGDCLLEVNGEDIVGFKIGDIAELVRSRPNQVSLLLWNAGLDAQCNPESLCCGPIPSNLQKLSACMSTILAVLECPVCLDMIPPPVHQCDNGHLICARCRIRTERCPVCRMRFSHSRSLLADQVYNSLINSFGLREESVDIRTARIRQIFSLKNKPKNVPDIKVTYTHTNKFLAKIRGKSSSVDNISSSKSSSSKSYLSVENNLNTKSLSTGEIYRSRSSELISQSRPLRLDNKNSIVSRPVSYHGSFENLSTKTENGIQPDFNCPFDCKCTTLVKGPLILEHFKEQHNGPLVQYFTKDISIPVSQLQLQNETSFLIKLNEQTFFLKTLLSPAKNVVFKNMQIWTWILDDKKTNGFSQKLKIRLDSAQQELLNANCSVYPLSTYSWKQIEDDKCGISISGDILSAVIKTSTNIICDISIVRS